MSKRKNKKKSPSEIRNTRKWLNIQQNLADRAIDEIERQFLKERHEQKEREEY